MKCLIIEDEFIAARRLEKMVQEIRPGAVVLDMLQSVESSVDFLNQNEMPDLIFMDIQLSDGLSFNIIDKCQISCPIIFTTSYNEYQIKAMENGAAAFLLKPIKRNELQNVLDQSAGTTFTPLSFEHKNEATLLVKYGQKYYVTRSDEIGYLYRRDGFSVLVRKDGFKLPIHLSMDEILRSLGDTTIVKIADDLYVQKGLIETVELSQENRSIQNNIRDSSHWSIHLDDSIYEKIRQWIIKSALNMSTINRMS